MRLEKQLYITNRNGEWSMKNKKMSVAVIIGAVVVSLGLLVVVCFRLFGGFDAGKYVSAVCEQILEGDVEAAIKMTRGLTKEKAQEQHEEMVQNFVNNVIASGLTLEKEEQEACVEITKQIFSSLKYEVEKTEKVSDEEFRVTIRYQETNVIEKLQALAKEESAKASQKANKGEYEGTVEEINEQIQKEFAEKLPSMLEEAYETMTFGEEKTMVLTVKKNEKGLYSADISEFIVKMMGLTTKQD